MNIDNGNTIPYEILDYQKYRNRIDNIIRGNGTINKNSVIQQDVLGYTDCGFPIEQYSIGNGNKHILIMGGTHGCEIISVDFVTQLMEKIAKGEIPNFSPNEFTIDFIPLHNPEGFIISSSAANFKLAGKSDEEIEKFCKEYYLAYRQDDINTRNNPNDRSYKLHHQLFAGITVDCIPSLDIRYEKLKEKVKKILNNKMGEYSIPAESLIDWRANGNGVELNGNTPTCYKNELKRLEENNGIVFGANRFNSIPRAIPGPIGISSADMSKFKFEEENIYLFSYLSKMNKNKQHYATFTYHGTGGLIYYRPFDLKQRETEKVRLYKDTNNIAEVYNFNDFINDQIAKSYSEKTGYRHMGTPSNLTGVGDVLRSVYPCFMLVELSRMGGNPIAPYGDRYGNYESTIRINMDAFNNSLDTIRALDNFYWRTFEVPREIENRRRSR